MIDQKVPENLEYFKYLDSMMQGDARCVTGIISRFAMAKLHSARILRCELN
jgi:hypothetical protein